MCLDQGSILGPLLFIIFINGIDEDIVSDILKFADDTKLCGKAGSSESRDRLKEDLRVLCSNMHNFTFVSIEFHLPCDGPFITL